MSAITSKFPAPKLKAKIKPISISTSNSASNSASAPTKKIAPAPVVPRAPSLPEWRMVGLARFKKYLEIELAKQLEMAVYLRLCNKYLNDDAMIGDTELFQSCYKCRIRDISGLINSESPNYQARIKKSLDDGELKPENLVIMKPWEACPEAWKTTIDAFQKELSGMAQKTHASCTLFTCGRCGHKDTTYYEMQSRSSDEPMTTYITCNNCMAHWKQ